MVVKEQIGTGKNKKSELDIATITILIALTVGGITASAASIIRSEVNANEIKNLKENYSKQLDMIYKKLDKLDIKIDKLKE